MIAQIDHLVITTAQPQVLLPYYEALGFCACKASERYELFAGDFKINVHIAGSELLPHAGCVQTGSADLCFALAVPLSHFTAHLSEMDIPIALGPVARHGAKGPMQSVYLRDPDGNLLEFCSYD